MQQQQQLSETNSYKYNWEGYDIGQIIGGVSPDGTRFLKLFLQDYTALFSEVVNPSCSKCLNNYLQKYKLKKFEMQNNSQYRLKEKYNGIPLGFGSAVLVNNSNLTDEYALELLQRFEAETIFDVFPVEEIKQEKEVIKSSLRVKRNRIQTK